MLMVNQEAASSLLQDYQKHMMKLKRNVGISNNGIDETLDLAFSHQRGKLAVFFNKLLQL